MKVSIFTPTNNSEFLPKLYESIKDQDFHEWIIVYNNGGVPVKFDDERVKSFILYKSPGYVGTVKAYACEQATGDILLELDHDDLLMPTAIEDVKQAFEDKEVGFVYSNTIQATGDFKKVERFDERYGWKFNEINYNGCVLDELVAFEPDPCTISRIWFAPNHLRAFRKEIYDKIGGYNTEMRVLDDSDLISRMYLETKLHHINKPLYLYRIHGQNSWLIHNKEIQDNVYGLHDKYIDDLVNVWSDRKALRKLDLGARFHAKEGYETVDLKDCDINFDLNGEWPIQDSSVGVVRAIDVLEHLSDPIHAMKEIYRVLVPGGYAMIRVPSTDGRGAFQDPTHKSFWNQNSFFYYTKSFFAKYIDTPVRFQAMRLYTTEKTSDQVCWVIAQLVSLKDGYRPCGLVEI